MNIPARGRETPGAFEAFVPLSFVLLWSTGFVGSKLGFPYAEPFTFLSVRFALTIALLLLIARLTRANWPASWAEVRVIAASGLLLHALYLSGTWYAIYLGLPAGIAALIVGLQPVLTAALSRVLGEHVSRRVWAGLALGFLGVVLVVLEKLLHGRYDMIQPAALLAITLALIGTTTGTLHQKRYSIRMPLVSGTIIQYVATLAITWPAALLFETRHIEWTLPFVFALGWLVLGLSVGAVFLLLYLLRSRATARVTSLLYLVPPVTALEAYVLFQETLGWTALAGLLVAAFGVGVVATDRETT